MLWGCSPVPVCASILQSIHGCSLLLQHRKCHLTQWSSHSGPASDDRQGALNSALGVPQRMHVWVPPFWARTVDSDEARAGRRGTDLG